MRGRGLEARGELFELLRQSRIADGSRREGLHLRAQLVEALGRCRDAGRKVVEARAKILKLLRRRGLLESRGELLELLRERRITRGSRRQALDLRAQLGDALWRRGDAGGEIVEPRSELVQLL